MQGAAIIVNLEHVGYSEGLVIVRLVAFLGNPAKSCSEYIIPPENAPPMDGLSYSLSCSKRVIEGLDN